MAGSTYITFTNNGPKTVTASLWWGKLPEGSRKVPPGGSTNFNKNTTSFGKAWDGWTVEVKDVQNYILATCYSLCHNAKVTLSAHGQHGYQSTYAFKVN